MTLGQQEPVLPSMSHQPPARLYQPLLQAVSDQFSIFFGVIFTACLPSFDPFTGHGQCSRQPIVAHPWRSSPHR